MTVQVQNSSEREEKEKDEECLEDYEEQGMLTVTVRLQTIHSVAQRVSNIINQSFSSQSSFSTLAKKRCRAWCCNDSVGITICIGIVFWDNWFKDCDKERNVTS